MKVGTVRVDDALRIVVELDDEPRLLDAADGSLDLLFDSGADVQERLVQGWKNGAAADLATLRWAPPLRRPGKILCVALNNSANPQRIISGPEEPSLFVKPTSSMVGHGEPIRLRSYYGVVHPEPELAVVVGRTGRDIDEQDAMDHVFGYTMINDLTSPTMRREDTFHYRSVHPGTDGQELEYRESWATYLGRYKGSDTFGPIGPWIVTTDEIPDPHALRVTCTHRDRLITEDTTANLRFSVRKVIAFASRFLTLEAGDVIAMGTALKRSEGAPALQTVDLTSMGGPLSMSIEGIGTLTNPVEVDA
ncbi:fumarylacetoacetate hydrolase family protein [Prescottella equi]|uniref:fumarylacetoacetate hydrolase family protein n=1 Tax=Rhodococcus hoagii TaxID=43767 RepID=UPI0007CD6FDD|nr:fumarylacetoacetate hydrolase family protein [Prescottella equi]